MNDADTEPSRIASDQMHSSSCAPLNKGSTTGSQFAFSMSAAEAELSRISLDQIRISFCPSLSNDSLATSELVASMNVEDAVPSRSSVLQSAFAEHGTIDLLLSYDDNAPVTTFWRCVALLGVISHVFLILGMIGNVLYALPEDEITEFYSLLLAPYLTYLTIKHWWRGTYFPFVAADKFHIVRTGYAIDKTPRVIKCSLMWQMVLISFLLLDITSNTFFRVIDRLDDDDFDELPEWQQFAIICHCFACLFAVLGKWKSSILGWIFFFLMLSSMVVLIFVSCGCVWIFFLKMCIKGIKPDDSIMVPPKYSSVPLISLVSFFYRNID
eukprot:TRINITY_DN58686_c0_g1_i1.p1 TRINITY_DN58686_c0_g1~~TRINITY_DN58686_c0_g1_i1.p1  ORF type:complete len:326 (-),score=25.28 TRINITY_DN58686_c0_g1_i1:76-1053(-)